VVREAPARWLCRGDALAVQFLAGHPQLVSLRHHRCDDGDGLRLAGRCPLRRCLPFGGHGGVAIALCGVQILPTLAMAPNGRSM
jgi:hypothetical protein